MGFPGEGESKPLPLGGLFHTFLPPEKYAAGGISSLKTIELLYENRFQFRIPAPADTDTPYPGDAFAVNSCHADALCATLPNMQIVLRQVIFLLQK